MTHTKEPWRMLEGDGPKIAVGPFVTNNLGGVLVDPLAEVDRVEDARRIVACVNALAGVPTEDLEADDGFMSGLRFLVRNHNQAHEDAVRA